MSIDSSTTAPDAKDADGKLKPDTGDGSAGDRPAVASPTVAAPPAEPRASTASPGRHPTRRRRLILLFVLIALIVATILTYPWIHQALVTVSTDDAYVNGHVTSVAARVPGQVMRVLVDDNNRVRKGDLLVELDKEPYKIAVDQKKAAVITAKADVAAAIAQVRAVEGQTRSARWKLAHAIDNVDNQIELLKTNVASLDSARAIQKRAAADVERAKAIIKTGAIAPEEFDRRQQVLAVAEAQVKEALQGVYQTRVSLGLPAQPEGGGSDLAQVPPDLDQTEPSVRQAQYEVFQNGAQLGVELPFDLTPKEMIAEFLKRDPEGNIDRIYAQLLTTAPAVKQAQAKLEQAQRDLALAELDLRYCDVISEIDGIVTRRNVNPGNNVVAGQAVMAIRSLREIWVDANFKETQLADLRIGQHAKLEVDTYGSRHVFAGHISGFTFGTGSTLALLPAQNATGNFVKVVQRLPVRIDLDDYDPDKVPLFVGLSVTPYVYVKDPPTGPSAGKVLQPNEILPVPAPAASQPSTQP